MGFRCHAIFQVKSHWVCRNVYTVHCMLYFPIYIRDYEHNFLFTFLSAEWTTVWRIMSLCFSSRTKDSNSFSQNACTKEKKKRRFESNLWHNRSGHNHVLPAFVHCFSNVKLEGMLPTSSVHRLTCLLFYPRTSNPICRSTMPSPLISIMWLLLGYDENALKSGRSICDEPHPNRHHTSRQHGTLSGTRFVGSLCTLVGICHMHARDR